MRGEVSTTSQTFWFYSQFDPTSTNSLIFSPLRDFPFLSSSLREPLIIKLLANRTIVTISFSLLVIRFSSFLAWRVASYFSPLLLSNNTCPQFRFLSAYFYYRLFFQFQRRWLAVIPLVKIFFTKVLYSFRCFYLCFSQDFFYFVVRLPCINKVIGWIIRIKI